MKTAAISEVKAFISEYLAKVKAGEEIIVTDRGKPVAKIVPLERGEMELPSYLLELERAGIVKIGAGKLPKGFWDIPRPRDSKGLALSALLKEREEGR